MDSRPPPSLSPRFYPPRGWAWGLVQVGDAPAQRYGVAAPEGVVKAQVLILPGYGETAEGWFETTNQLVDRGYAVWVLEGAGQGGSGRLADPRDLGHAVSLGPDVAAALAMIKAVTPPVDHAPFVLLGQGAGGVVALSAAETGVPLDGLIVSVPIPSGKSRSAPPQWLASTLGGLRAPGGHGWRRDEATPPGVDATRNGVQQAWMLANPDLRMGGPSLGWIAALDAASTDALKDRSRVSTPALWIGAPNDACATLPLCESAPQAGSTPSWHLAIDPARKAWLATVTSFIDARIVAKRAHGS